MKRFLTLAMVLAVGLVGAAAQAGTFGPDDFGYIGMDMAEESVTYEWVDTSGGTALTMGDDEQSEAIPIGFDFVFYGQTYNEAFVLSNGAFLLERQLEYPFFAGEQCPLPQDGEVNAMVAFFHRDFNPSDAACGGDCSITWAQGGEAPNRWFAVSYTNVPVYREAGADADPVTAQAVLYEGSNEIKIQVANSGLNTGGDATVGIEGADAIAGLNVPGCMTEGSIPNEFAVVFAPPSGGTPVVPPQRSAWEQPGEAITYEFTIFNLEADAVTFDVAVADNTWETASDSATVEVLAGASSSFSVTVDIPADVAGGASDQATITLTPQGGGDAINVTTLTLAQDAPDEWQIAFHMPYVLDSMAVAVDGTDLWLFGGVEFDELALQKLVADIVQVLHTETGVWENSVDDDIAAMPDVRVDARACAVGGKVYLTGGQTLDQETPVASNLFIYDIASNEWSEGAAMPAGRMNHAVVCAPDSNYIYVIGGLGPPVDGVFDEVDTLWAYDIEADSWDDSLASMPTTRSYLTAELVDGDQIIVAGGFVDDFLDVRSDIYDIGGDTWTQTGDLNVERLLHASARLDGERACVIGGSSVNALLEDTFECFSNGFWIPQIALLNTARTFVMGATIGTQMYVMGGVETDSPFQPTEYTAYDFIERYPTAEIPEPPPEDVVTGEDTVTGEDVPTTADVIAPPDDTVQPGDDVPPGSDTVQPQQDTTSPGVDTGAPGTDTAAPGTDGGVSGDDTGGNGGGGGGGCTAGGSTPTAPLALFLLLIAGLALIRRRRA